MLYPCNNVNKIIKQGKIWVIQKNTVVEEKLALKKEELEKKIRKNSSYKVKIQKIKSISVWIFLVPFVSDNIRAYF